MNIRLINFVLLLCSLSIGSLATGSNQVQISELPDEWKSYTPDALYFLYQDAYDLEEDQRRKIQYVLVEHVWEKHLNDLGYLAQVEVNDLLHLVSDWYVGLYSPRKLKVHQYLQKRILDHRSVFLEIHFSTWKRLHDDGWMMAMQSQRFLRWMPDWIDHRDDWREANADDLFSLFTYLSSVEVSNKRQRALEVLAGCVFDRVKDDSILLGKAYATSLIESIEPYLNEQQNEQLQHALATALAQSPNLILKDLRLAQFEKLRQQARRLGITPQQRAEWFNHWLAHGTGWQVENAYRLALVLHTMEKEKHLVDLAPARAAVIDHVLGRAEREPQWVSTALLREFSRFTLYLARAMWQDARFAEPDQIFAGLAPVLNATDPWRTHPTNKMWRRDFRPNDYLLARYQAYQLAPCCGSDSGEARTGEAILEGLTVGLIEPRPAVLYMLAWHQHAQGRLDEWTVLVDKQIANSETAQPQKLWWLLGRAYIEDIATVPAPGSAPGVAIKYSATDAGRVWLHKAMEAAPDDTSRLNVLQIAFVDAIASDQLEAAKNLLDQWESKLIGESTQHIFETMHRLLEQAAMASTATEG